MANAVKKRRKKKNELLGIEIRQTQLEGECELFARQIAADKDSLSSMTNQSDYQQVQHRINKNTKSLEIHQCALAAIPMQTYAAEQGLIIFANSWRVQP